MLLPVRTLVSRLFRLQIVELRMCALSNRIREKPDWWERVKNETIVERWREEASQQAEDNEEPAWNLWMRGWA